MCRRDLFILITALALFAVPIVVDVLLSGERGPFAYLAADAFYYLVVARNTLDFGVVSFDQMHATNGFHPLWQLILVLLFACSRTLGLSDLAVLYAVVSLCLVLVGIFMVYLACSLQRVGEFSVSFLFLPVGAVAALLVPLWLAVGRDRLAAGAVEGYRPLPTTLWTFVNGMESGVLLAAFGATFYYFVSRGMKSRRSALVLGGLLAIMTLGRLDHGCFAIALLFGLFIAARVRHDVAVRRRCVVAACSFSVPLLVYLIVNRMYGGSFFPVSGAMKRVFPAGNLEATVAYVLAGGLDAKTGYRLIPTIVPSVVGIAYLAVWIWRSYRRRPGAEWLDTPTARFDFLMLASAAGTFALGAHNFLFVPYISQGHWYYPVSSVWTTLVALLGLRVVGARVLPDRDHNSMAIVASILWTILCVGLFVGLHRHEAYHRRFAWFFHVEAPRVRAHYGNNRPRLIEMDDGLVAFSTGFPTLSGIGLALDREAAHAFPGAQFFQLARRRGFDRMATLQYGDFTHIPDGQVASRFQGRFRHHVPGTWPGLSVDYRSGDGSFVIVRMVAESSDSLPR